MGKRMEKSQAKEWKSIKSLLIYLFLIMFIHLHRWPNILERLTQTRHWKRDGLLCPRRAAVSGVEVEVLYRDMDSVMNTQYSENM